MLKKEFNEIIKQSLYFIVFIVCLPVLIFIGARIFGSPASYLQTFFPVYQVGLMIFALVSGISLFTSERRQDGIEYLLTLPMSRFKLLAVKIVPRLCALIVFSLLYVLLVQILTSGADSMQLMYALPAGLLFLLIFSLFITAVSLSACHRNFLVSALLALVIFSAFAAAIYIIIRTWTVRNFLWSIGLSYGDFVHVFPLLLPLPLLFSFIFSFRKFDVGAGKSFNRSYVKLLVPFLIIGIILSFIYLYSIKEPANNFYYLTKEHKLVETSYFSTRVYDGEDVIKVDAEGSYFLEHGDYLYIRSYIEYWQILRLNKKNYRVEKFYEGQGWIGYHPGIYKNTIVFIESYRGTERYIVAINLDTKAVKKIRLPDVGAGGFQSPSVFGTDEAEGKRFWLLITGRARIFPLFRIWEDGRAEKIGFSRTYPLYVNHRMVTADEKSIFVSELKADGVEVVRELHTGTHINFIGSRLAKNFNNDAVQEIYAYPTLSTERLFRVDMETLESGWLQGFEAYVNYFYPNGYYYSEMQYDKQEKIYYVKNISRLRNGKIELLKDFKGEKTQWLFPHGYGIFVKSDGKLKVYAIPGLEELTFKGLN